MNEYAPNTSHTKTMLLILYTKDNFLFCDLCFLALSLTPVLFLHLCLKRKYLFSVMAQDYRELQSLQKMLISHVKGMSYSPACPNTLLDIYWKQCSDSSLQKNWHHPSRNYLEPEHWKRTHHFKVRKLNWHLARKGIGRVGRRCKTSRY